MVLSITQVVQILAQRTKNNPCLVGEPGVSRTAIAEGLAQRIASGDVPETLEGKTVLTLDMGFPVAGTKYCGKFEERLNELMRESRQRDDIILFIDEVHTLTGAFLAANILKSALARGGLQCIGATTLAEYRRHIENDRTWAKLFQPVKVPTVEKVSAVESSRLLQMEQTLHTRVIGQDEAVKAISRAIRRARVGFKNPNGPIRL